MKTKVIHIAKGGVPRFTPPEEPDSPIHRTLRHCVVFAAVLLYVLYVVIWFFDIAFTLMNPIQIFMPVFLVLMSPIVADYFIRPGKRSLWFFTILGCILAVGFSLLFFVIPLVLLFYGIFQSIRNAHRKP